MYGLVIENPRIGLCELAGRLDRSQEAVSELIRRMVELSLLQPPGQGDASFIATHPLLAIRQMIEREQVALEEHWQRLQRNYEALLSVLPKLAANVYHPTEHRPPERIGTVHQIHHTIESLIVHAREQIQVFMAPSDNKVCVAVADRLLHVAALRQGVTNRVIYPEAGRTDPAGLIWPADLHAGGTEIRLVRDLPIWLVIVDGATAVLPADGSRPDGAALLIRDSGTVAALTALFESFWTQGSLLAVTREKSDGQCTDLDREILCRLASGQTDEAVARHVEVSVRTLRRHVAALMKQVDARSRFELAIEATARGWVKPTSAR
jgi:DNA-binding CsgD family transcriptional regulator